MKFDIVTHKNREEWLQWRHNGIGSSDVPVIMGVSKYKTVKQLLEEKSKPFLSEDKSNWYIKNRGNLIESTVRKFYEEDMGMEFPAISCVNKEHPYLIATLDGADKGMNLFIEIKLLSSQKPDKVNKEAEGYKRWEEAKVKEIIPKEYYPQIQHQLMVTGLPACVFLGYKEVKDGSTPNKDNVAIVSVLPNTEYIDKMRLKLSDFWMKVLENRSKVNEDTNKK